MHNRKGKDSMNRKVISLLLAGLMVTSVVGCGDSSSEASPETGNAAANAEDENTLSIAAWDPNFNIPALKAAEAAYQKKNPDFQLNIITQSAAKDIEDSVTLAASAGDYSNLSDLLLFQDHRFQRYVNDYPDAWISLDDADIDWAEFGDEKLSYSTSGDVHFGVPLDNGTVIAAYRTDILEECGYTIDDLTGITWDRFDEIGQDIYATTGKYLLSMYGSGNDLPYMMMQAEGQSQFKDGEPYLSENETFMEVIDVLTRLVQDNVLYLANDGTEYTDQTIVGDMVAGVMNGNWIIPTIEINEDNAGKWEITSMPTLSGEEGFASNGGSSIYISSNCKNEELAKDFLAYTFGGGEGAAETYDNALKDGGVISCYGPAGESEAYQEGVAYFNDQPIYKKIVEMGTNVKIVEQSDYDGTCKEQVSTALQNILSGSDPKEAMKDAEEQLRFEMGL